MTATLAIAFLAALVFLGIAFEEVFRRTGIPDVLLLLAVGLLLRLTGLVSPARLLPFEHVFTTVALVVVLFEGAMRIRIGDLKRAWAATIGLTLLTFVFTLAVFTVLGTLLFSMRPIAAVILAAILACSSPTVIVPLVQGVTLTEKTRTALALESALADVLAVVLTLSLVDADSSGAFAWGSFALHLTLSLGGALVVGALGGAAWLFGLRALRKSRPTLLATIAVVLLVYAAAEAIGTSGAIAALATGLVLGNAPQLVREAGGAADLGVSRAEDLFHRDIAFLLKVFFFVYLGVSIDLSGFEPFVFGGVATLALFALRPFAVRLSFRPSTTPRRDARIAAALMPKGIAAAILASIPLRAGIPEGEAIRGTAVGVILFSIVLASVLVFAIDMPFVADAYDRLFRRYPGSDRAPQPRAFSTAK